MSKNKTGKKGSPTILPLTMQSENIEYNAAQVRPKTFKQYCDKCKKITDWTFAWGYFTNPNAIFSSNALLESWANFSFQQYGICRECERRVPCPGTWLFGVES
ncbi:MAG TPA: hypothetical protein DCQ58_06535 [Saprospirales bacterium]|jgi:hypothetical protein|nr:hypothetical protein [Saprospirales bacterium]HRJ55775.1 hypothetical protein [Anaerolineales bacterium]HRK88063.1 hypothetical protein [Anaerolineales bacterium]